MELDNATIKRLKGIGHELKPIVMIGNNGVTPAISEEINRALDDHELIKIKLPAGSKHDRDVVSTEIATMAKATIIHTIGRMALLLRQNPNANPKLSNLARHAQQLVLTPLSDLKPQHLIACGFCMLDLYHKSDDHNIYQCHSIMTQTFALNLATDTLDTDANKIGVTVNALKQIEVCASIAITQNPEPSLLLKFDIKLNSDTLADQLDWPVWQQRDVSFEHYLWERTCLECFIQNTALDQNNSTSYIEINVSPSGHYAFYQFEGYRNPSTLPPIPLIKKGGEKYATIMWCDTSDTSDTQRYQRRFAIPLTQMPQHVFDNQSVIFKRLNLCVILYFGDTALYFAKAHPTPPDFHNQQYWLDFDGTEFDGRQISRNLLNIQN